MLKKLIMTTLCSIGLFAALPVQAEDTSCRIQFAVSTPPVQYDQNVAFNVTNEIGMSKSITLVGGSAPKFIENIPCSQYPLTLSATYYSTPGNNLLQGPIIGQCQLKAGVVMLNGPDNSVSVVFPYDFNCDK